MVRELDSNAGESELDHVLADYMRRVDRGEPAEQETLIAAHPELAAELRAYFSQVVAVERVAVGETPDFAHHDTPRGALEVRCPSCHAPMEVALDTALTDLTCSACGSHFSLVDQNKATWEAPSLTTLGRFELVERLGVGGFGSVWKARDKELDRTVAIKIPRAGDMSAVDQEKFFREARAAAQLRHPSIVSVHEVGRDGESVYIVSDFIRGVTLGDWLTGQQLTKREAADLCARIADALHYAHEQGVVHRDLKPANIMIDAYGEPHLMDFGLARREVGEVTVTMDGQVLGTPAYMSPEQAQGEGHTADRRSDVYSLGVILFQLLTGELPFRGNARMLIHQVMHDEPPSPRKLNANISQDLETITLKCLDKDRGRRYRSALELAEELRRFTSGQPIHARPIGAVERAWRWAKRKPALSALLLAIVLLVATTIAAGSREIYTQRRANAQFSDNLLTTAELYGRRGEWENALRMIDEAGSIGHGPQIQVSVARLKALEALNRIPESRDLLDSLYNRDDLGEHRAEVTFLKGMSLLMQDKSAAGIELLCQAKQISQLPASNRALLDAITATNSESALKSFELSLAEDPFSQESHTFVIFALTMAGRYDEALEHARAAMLLFPDDPNLPIFAAYIEAMRGNSVAALSYLDSRACKQLKPETLKHFRTVIEYLPKLYTATFRLWDITPTADSTSLSPVEQDAFSRVQKAIFAIDSLDSHTMSAVGPFVLLEGKGPVCYQTAYKVLDDLGSLQTIGFLAHGDGDLQRIDRLIQRLAESSKIHPDAYFEFCRGRLLFERGRLPEATAAFAAAADQRSMFSEVPRLACFFAAFCEYELFQTKQIQSLDRATKFVRKRLSAGEISAEHANALLGFSLAGKDYDSARALVQYLDQKKLGEDGITYRKAEIEFHAENYVAVLKLCKEISATSPNAKASAQLNQKALAKILDIASKEEQNPAH